MRIKIIGLVLFLSFFIGCKGEKGEKGDSGTGTSTTYTGLVTSDTQLISVPAYKTGSTISVYVGNGTQFTETPYYLNGAGVNLFYAAQVGFLTLYNAQLGSASNYKIVVINPAGSAGLSSKERIFN